MELYEALKVLAAALVAVFGFVSALDKVLDIIHKYVKKAKAPDDAQNKRLDEMDKRLQTLETGYAQHSLALGRDLSRFGEIDEVNRLTLEAVRALLEAQLTGNNVPAMQASKEKIDKYLMEGVTKHGSNA